MSTNPRSAEQHPLQINTLTSNVTEHQGMKIINRPEGVMMAWESEPDLDINAMATANGFSNVALDTMEDMMTGETRSVASVEMSHEEYEAFRNQPHVRPLELPAMVPEATSNTLGQLTFMPPASAVRAEYANPPEPAPEGIETPEAPPGERSSERLTTLKAQREANKNQLIDPDAADEYVRFDDLNQSVDELIGQIKGEPGTLTDYAAQATRGVLGFTSDVFFGVGELVYEGGKLAVDAAQTMTPSGLQGQVLDAQILMEEIRLGNITSDTVVNNTTQMVSAIGQSVAAPVTEPWNNGQYVEAVTRGGAEIASLPLVVLKGNKLNKAAKAADAASDASSTARAAGAAQDATSAVKSAPVEKTHDMAGSTAKATETAKIADTASDASTAKKSPDASASTKAKEPTGPTGNGGKVKTKQKVIRTAAQDREEITRLSNEANVARKNGDHRLADAKLAEAREILKPHIPQKPGDTWDGFIERLDVNAPKDGTTLWSGNQPAAQRFAESIGGSTLEGTPGGRVIDGWSDINNIPWKRDPSLGPGSGSLWNGVSKKIANSATGEIHVVQTPKKLWDQGTVWHNIEKPIIRDSYSTGRITDVNMHVLNGKNQPIPLSKNYINDLLDLEGIPR